MSDDRIDAASTSASATTKSTAPAPSPSTSPTLAASTASVRLPVDAPRPVALWPLVAIAFALTGLATLLMNVGTLNLDAFVAVQSAAGALPDPFWAFVTICGTGVVAFAILSPTLLRSPRFFAAAVASAGLAGLYANLLKRLFALPRPASVVDAAHLHVIGQTLHADTFPSGHAVAAFTLAAVVVLAARRPLATACWAVPLAVLVALSRVAVGAHWPADIAAGAAGGWISGALGVFAIDRWRFWNRAAGIRVLGVVAIGIGISLVVIDLGYPLALPLQYACAGVAVAAGVAAIARPRTDPLLPIDERSHPR